MFLHKQPCSKRILDENCKSDGSKGLQHCWRTSMLMLFMSIDSFSKTVRFGCSDVRHELMQFTPFTCRLFLFFLFLFFFSFIF